MDRRKYAKLVQDRMRVFYNGANHLPVRPFPALQWIAATLLGSAFSQRSTSLQNFSISSTVGGLWSSNAYTETL